MILRSSRALFSLAALLALGPLASADNHKWQIQEIFSSADESVQFIELLNTDKDEHHLDLVTLTTASGSMFHFPNPLPSSATENKRVLIATAAFAAIPGAPTPDYIIPAGFIERTGDMVIYPPGPDSVAFGPLPIDGLKSIGRTGSQANNTPTNFAGQSATIRLATAMVRNGSGVNELRYSSAPPVLGSNWNATLDASGHPGSTVVIIMGYTGGGSGPVISYGQVLFSGMKVFSFQKVSNGGLNSFSVPVPNRPTLIGKFFATQGLILGGGIELVNAVDLRLGH